MDSKDPKKDLFRKYARILQVDDRTKSRRGLNSSAHTPLTINDHSELVDRFLKIKKRDGIISPTLQSPSSSSFFQSSKFKLTPDFRSTVTSPNGSVIKTHLPTMENIHTISSFEIQPDERMLTMNKSNVKFDERDLGRSQKMESFDKKDFTTSTACSIPTLKKSHMSPTEKNAITLEDLFHEARDFSEELKLIVSQEQEEMSRAFAEHLNVKEFIKIQKTRMYNVIRVIERGFTNKLTKESKLKMEIWKLASSEINRVKLSYDDFLQIFEENLDAASKGKKRVDDQTKIWEALRLLPSYSGCMRLRRLYNDEASQNQFGDVVAKLLQFKVDYKLSRDYKPRMYEIFEMLEDHIKELNQSIDEERSKASSILHQQEVLIEGHVKIEKKNDSLKTEMLGLIQDWKEGLGNRRNKGMPMFQEKIMKENMQQLEADVGKLSEENQNLKRELKEVKIELKKLMQSQDKSIKLYQDKGTMVEYHTKDFHAPTTVTLSSYLVNPDLYTHGSKLSKELLASVINTLYCDKMIADLYDDYENRPKKCLNTYIKEWVLRKFGMYSFSEAILKDVLHNLSLSGGIERQRIFKDFLGIENARINDSFKFSFFGSVHQERGNLRKAALGTSEMLKQYFKIIKYIKVYCIQSTESSFKQNHGPYLPSFGMVDELITVDSAQKVVTKIIEEECFNSEESHEVQEYFYYMQQHDLLDREAAQVSIGNPDESDGSGPKTIRFDTLAKFLLDVCLEKQLGIIERYHTALHARSTSQKAGIITYDDYLAGISRVNPEATQAWKDHSFALLMEQCSNPKANLLLLMENFIPIFFNEDKVKGSNSVAIFDRTPKASDRKKPPLVKQGSKRTSMVPKSPKLSPVANSQQTLPSSFQGMNQSPLGHQSKEKLLIGYKEVFNHQDPSMNDTCYEMYDAISSLVLLQESYYSVEDKIQLCEKSMEGVEHIHNEFVGELMILPKKVSRLGSTDAFNVYGKEELVDFVEHLWYKFRNLIAVTLQPKYI